MQKGTKEIHRLCDFCIKERRFLEEYVKENKLSFGKSSLQGQKWIKAVQQKPGNSKTRKESSSSLYSGRFSREIFN